MGARVEIIDLQKAMDGDMGRPSRGGASRNTVLALRKGISFRRPSRGGASRNIQSGLGIGGFGVSPLPWGRE